MASLSYFEILLALVAIILLALFTLDMNGLPWNWPFVGMLPTLVVHLNRFPDRATDILCRSNRCTFLFKGFWFSESNLLATADPANVHHIANTNFDNYPKGPDFRDMFDILGDGIFAADSDSWKNQRKFAHNLMKDKRYSQLVAKTSKIKMERGLAPILDHLSDRSQVCDLQDLFERLFFDSTCISIFGFDPSSLSVELEELAFAKAMANVEEIIFLRHFIPKFYWKLQKFLGFGAAKVMSNAWKTIDQTIYKLLFMKRQELLHEQKDKGEIANREFDFDMLTSYLNEDLMTSMGLKSDDKFLRDTIFNLLSAGLDTTGSALSWFLFLVIKNPLVQSKIREELQREILDPTNEADGKWRLFDIEEVDKLVYLHGALFESLRLYPPVPFNHKVSIKHDILPSGHHVNPNMKVIIPMYAMGRMKQVWGEDCLEFKPERWISDEGRIKHQQSFKFTAFFSGPRACLGRETALIQIKIFASSIIHNYNVEVVDGQHVIPSSSVVLHMKHGFKVKVTKRWA